jgi:hypothetical protein
MKTPRELLLEKHREVGPKLDRIRQTVLRRECGWRGPTEAEVPVATLLAAGWYEKLLTVRWHLSGLGAAWVLVILLTLSQSAPPAGVLVPHVALGRSSAPVAAAVRQNRRLLSELLAPQTGASVAAPSPSNPSRPRSQARPPRMAMA